MLRVMLVDDEEHALAILEIFLREFEHVDIVGSFTDPFQALEQLETLRPDVVFLDIQMPRLMGIEAAERIKGLLPEIQFVFTTAYSEYAVRAFEIQSVDYLLKPFTKERLRNTISRFKKAGPSSKANLAADMMPEIYIQCFGGFHIHTASGIMSWKTNKEKELCAFLVHHRGKQVDAATIIESLWRELELNKAKTYLYTCMSFLRKSFLANGINDKVDKAGRGYVIELAGIESDVAAFLTIVDQAAAEEAMDEKRYEKLNVLMKGDYMQGCDYDWAIWKREELKNKYVQTLRIAAKHFLRKGNIPLAADSLQRILTISPDSEKDGRDLIRLCINTDKRNEALKVYRQLEQAVRGNLGVELEEETVRLYKSVTLFNY
ncbi:response regulator [Paenibacillus thalictri]|uniref:Response regulator n=1 Tax=Paenibacillus thalictri TaxID=2527873 RepID=A0A4V2J3X5_9BACL|nr:response regulator [Paenibacillus thalictri]TBL76270.1 response regulator [Paenibacillus thalictri]